LKISQALRDGYISEDSICAALTTARGDLFVASAYLSVTPRELDWYIRASDPVQKFVGAINRVKATPDYDRLSGEQFQDQLRLLTSAYRLEALDVIHDIATMPDDGPEPMSAAMMEVKLKAAIQLRGTVAEAPVNNQQSQVFKELNTLYQQAAPRIKSMRVAQIEFED
jgi:hypothetical protein